MSANRQLPQRPGQTPETPTSDGGDRGNFVYPPYGQHPPPPAPPTFERHRSYPSTYITHPPPQERHYFQPPPDLAQRPYGGSSGGAPGSGSGEKKRPRELSITSRDERISPIRRQSVSGKGRSESNASEQKANAPSVLVREKKQKACSNCRRAKLKCILSDDGGGECVRCKSRGERCVFFPRSHDEDWQQTITQDVYSAMSHLTHMTSAVSHMVNHLVANNVIPPLPPRDFPHGIAPYEMPDRDMTVLQGWNAEKNREDETRKRGKRKSSRVDEGMGMDGDEEDDDMRLNGMMMAGPGPSPMNGHGWAQLPPHPHPHPHPHAHLHAQPPPHHLQPPPPGMMHHQLPPYRAPGHPGQVQLTPTSELDLPPRGHPIALQPLAPSPSASGGSMHPPLHPAMLPQMPGQVMPGPSPSSAPIVTPTSASFVSSSISPVVNGNGLPPIDQPPVVATDNDVDVDVLASKTSPEQRGPDFDDDGNAIIGSADGRSNCIKRGLISHQHANVLVDHFHTHMAPFMFGYQIEFGRFPYLSDGPVSITPFILSVQCLVASDRVPQFGSFWQPLLQYVEMLLRESPAESWQNIQQSRESRNTDDTQDVLDPELGIGPEEIVGACILATYLPKLDQENRANIAESAFKWARGWIKLLTGGPRWTFAENLGIVPQERKAEWKDMSRIWLLCYICESSVQFGDADNTGNAAPDVYDPAFYCESLIRPEDPPEHASHYDVILVFRAKLAAILKKWYYRSVNLWKMGPNASFDLKRLANSTNDRLDQWQADFGRYDHMTRDESRQLVMFYDFVRVLSNSYAVSKLHARGMEEEPTRQSCLPKAITAALDFMNLVTEYTPRQVANLPTYDFKHINTVVEFVVDACMPGKGYDVDTPNGVRPLSAPTVRPLFEKLLDKFDPRHNETGPKIYLYFGESISRHLDSLNRHCP